MIKNYESLSLYNIDELQKNIDTIKNYIYEMNFHYQSNFKEKIEAGNWFDKLKARQYNKAYIWLDKATDSLNEAIHYLENFESTVNG
jgi:hypothetical protein